MGVGVGGAHGWGPEGQGHLVGSFPCGVTWQGVRPPTQRERGPEPQVGMGMGHHQTPADTTRCLPSPRCARAFAQPGHPSLFGVHPAGDCGGDSDVKGTDTGVQPASPPGQSDAQLPPGLALGPGSALGMGRQGTEGQLAPARLLEGAEGCSAGASRETGRVGTGAGLPPLSAICSDHGGQRGLCRAGLHGQHHAASSTGPPVSGCPGHCGRSDLNREQS